MPHINELYDFTTTVFIVYGGKSLLFQHPKYGMWLPVGGHIEMNEDPDTNLFREIKEECGLDVEMLSEASYKLGDTKVLTRPEHVSLHFANPPHQHISLVYYAKASSDKHVQSDEHTDSKWFTPAELQDTKYQINPDIIQFSLEAIERAG